MAEHWIARQAVDLVRGTSDPRRWVGMLLGPTDDKALEWILTVNRAGQPADLEGCVAAGYFLRPDGVAVRVAGEINDNVITIMPGRSCYNVPGELAAQVRLGWADGSSMELAEGLFYVGEDETGNPIQDGDAIPSLEALAAMIQDMEGAAQEARDAAQVALDAAGDVTEANSYAKQSESWAVGGTGVREDEDTDNAKYYAKEAEISKNTAISNANSARDYASQAANSAHSAQDVLNSIGKVTEVVPASYITQLNASYVGVTFTYDSERDALVIYGVSAGRRRILCLNGQNASATGSTEFNQTFEAGTYDCSTSITGHLTDDINWQYTYTTFTNSSPVLVGKNAPTAHVKFTSPAMVGLVIETGADYGTADDPTYVTFTATKLSAVDLQARKSIADTQSGFETLSGNVEAMQATHAQESDNGLTIVNGHYINYTNGNIGGDNIVFYYAEANVVPGMIVYYNAVKPAPDSRGLAFYDAHGNFVIGYQMIETAQRIVVPDNARLLRATVWSGALMTGVVFSGYNVAIEKNRELIDAVSTPNYGYFRNYSDITYSLQWQHKTYDENGALIDSDYNIMAEIPNVGNVEVKMNRPYVKFRIYVSSSPTSAVATMLQDWSHYFYRYTPDATGHLHYYVVVALESGGDTTSGAFTAGRRGIKVYTYEDSGINVKKCPSSLYGKRVAVLGDSIVQGRVRKNEATSTNTVQSKPWPYMVSEACGTEPADYGIGGAQVYGDDWLSLYTNRNQVSGYDVALVCAGTNDFGAEVSEANFKSAYADVLTALKANNTRVIAITPPSRQTNSPNQDGIYLSEYAQYIKDVAATANVNVIDLFALTESSTVFRANLPDGIHPNEIGQKIIADFVLDNMPND